MLKDPQPCGYENDHIPHYYRLPDGMKLESYVNDWCPGSGQHCDDLKEHKPHEFTDLKRSTGIIACEGRVSHGIEAWGDIIDEIDSRQDEAEWACTQFDRTNSEEAETF